MHWVNIVIMAFGLLIQTPLIYRLYHFVECLMSYCFHFCSPVIRKYNPNDLSSIAEGSRRNSHPPVDYSVVSYLQCQHCPLSGILETGVPAVVSELLIAHSVRTNIILFTPCLTRGTICAMTFSFSLPLPLDNETQG